jgi:hypothetical protein
MDNRGSSAFVATAVERCDCIGTGATASMAGGKN